MGDKRNDVNEKAAENTKTAHIRNPSFYHPYGGLEPVAGLAENGGLLRGVDVIIAFQFST